MNDHIILYTAKLSIILQIISGIIGLYGISIPLAKEHVVLREILILETIVQLIEFIYYVWLIRQFSKIQYNVTTTRYFDWMLSTPIMLISTAMFMLYRTLNKNNSKPLSLTSMIQTSSNPLGNIVGANALMLLFGYLGESGIISRIQGFIWGSLFFCISFLVLYFNFVGADSLNNTLFWFMSIIWAFYGVAYCTEYKTKNVMYNMLDIFSKNFYGFFLVYHIVQLKNDSS